MPDRLRQATAAYQQAIMVLHVLQEEHLKNNKRTSALRLWEGYVLRDLATAYSQAKYNQTKKRGEARTCLKRAMELRQEVLSELIQAVSDKRLLNQLHVEVLLVEMEIGVPNTKANRALLNRALKMLEQTRPRPRKPSGIWPHAFKKALEVAKASRQDEMYERLKALDPNK